MNAPCVYSVQSAVGGWRCSSSSTNSNSNNTTANNSSNSSNINNMRGATATGTGRRDTPSAWAVCRTDMHGNTVLMQTVASEAEAIKLAKEFEARGHKQTYTVVKGG